ncbi:MAG: SDR family oxidoreductase [Candidatus Hodarchaeales archaeon]|jgi:NAD(P)-dependent dehydrogenase (short-subunit alcohol dehydrogenase family)
MLSQSNARMKNQVCLITGATSGIGKATAMKLAELGATLVLLSRSQARGEVVKQEIVKRSQSTSIDVMIGDLGSLRSIQEFSYQFKENYDKLHILINNAGIYTRKRVETVDGYEKMLAINHLGHFFLTISLLDVLKDSSPSRIVNVASRAQRALNFDDLQSEENFSMMTVYGKSKLANILFTYELARRIEGSGVTVNCLHPGFVRTNLVRDFPWFMKPVMKLVMLMAKSSKKGAETSVYLASSPEVEGISGQYFINKQVQESTPASYDEAAAKRLWEISERLIQTKIPDFSTST